MLVTLGFPRWVIVERFGEAAVARTPWIGGALAWRVIE
jgi:hypothetical protein